MFEDVTGYQAQPLQTMMMVMCTPCILAYIWNTVEQYEYLVSFIMSLRTATLNISHITCTHLISQLDIFISPPLKVHIIIFWKESQMEAGRHAKCVGTGSLLSSVLDHIPVFTTDIGLALFYTRKLHRKLCWKRYTEWPWWEIVLQTVINRKAT
jgi:hypothetical protein